jgi:hypothetical protein
MQTVVLKTPEVMWRSVHELPGYLTDTNFFRSRMMRNTDEPYRNNFLWKHSLRDECFDLLVGGEFRSGILWRLDHGNDGASSPIAFSCNASDLERTLSMIDWQWWRWATQSGSGSARHMARSPFLSKSSRRRRSDPVR